MRAWLRSFACDASGVGALEYALIVGVVSIVLVVAGQALGGSLQAVFLQIGGALPGAAA